MFNTIFDYLLFSIKSNIITVIIAVLIILVVIVIKGYKEDKKSQEQFETEKKSNPYDNIVDMDDYKKNKT